jgi:hypothetical protein
VTTTSKCAERWLGLSLLALLIFAGSGCEPEPGPRRFSPTGEYFRLLDSAGRKYMILGEEDRPLGKLRIRDEEIKAYNASMEPVGTVEWRDEDGAVAISVTPRGGDSIQLRRRKESVDVYELPGRFRIERVERGWVVFDADGRRLGYVEESEPDEFALRDDYSSPPRAYARPSDPAVKTPSGRTVVAARPEFRAAPLLGFAFEGKLDALDRVAFGVWLEKMKPSK